MNDESGDITGLVRRIEHLLGAATSDERIVIAVAGIPGSGKSTVCSRVVTRAAEYGIGNVMVVPMDGFHYSKAELDYFSDPGEAYRGRGAPATFNAEAFLAAVRTIKAARVTQVRIPDLRILLLGFDHATQDPSPNAIVVPSTTKVVLLEGNYVLLKDLPWSKISALASEKWFVSVPREVAKERLVLRHIAAGIEKSAEDAVNRIEYNDLRNGDYIMCNSVKADVFVSNH